MRTVEQQNSISENHKKLVSGIQELTSNGFIWNVSFYIPLLIEGQMLIYGTTNELGGGKSTVVDISLDYPNRTYYVTHIRLAPNSSIDDLRKIESSISRTMSYFSTTGFDELLEDALKLDSEIDE